MIYCKDYYSSSFLRSQKFDELFQLIWSLIIEWPIHKDLTILENQNFKNQIDENNVMH